MAFQYTQELLDKALTYAAYHESIVDTLSKPPADEAAQKLRPYFEGNFEVMKKYRASARVSEKLKAVMQDARPVTWLVLSEGWCGDAAFNVPLLAEIEKEFPGKVKLQILLRDSFPEVMEANLTDGGRSIPKMIVLDEELEVLDNWGPRPEQLQKRMKGWKDEGLGLKELIPKVHDWYNADETHSLQAELMTLVESYSGK